MGIRITFNKDYYATIIKIDTENKKQLEIKKITLNIFERACFFFGLYGTIWTAQKSDDFRLNFAADWKKVEDEVTEATIFKKIFKIERQPAAASVKESILEKQPFVNQENPGSSLQEPPQSPAMELLPDDLADTVDEDPDAYTFSLHTDQRDFDLNDPEYDNGSTS